MKYIFSLILFLVSASVLSAQDVRILSSNSNSILIEFTPSVIDTQIINTPTGKFYKFTISNSFIDNRLEYGLPAILKREVNIGVPSSINKINVVSAEYSIINGKLAPKPFLKNVNGFAEYDYNTIPEYSNQIFNTAAEFGDFGLIRELKVQTISLFPINFDPSTNQIKIYKRIVVSINYGQSDGEFSELSDKELNSSILNWEVAKKWGEAKSNEFRLLKTSSIFGSAIYRLLAPEEGIYKIDRAFLQSVGINPDNVDPRTIKIYNNGGYPLSESQLESTDNLKEIAIYAFGEEDGVFNQSDYILFYGRSVDFWEYDKKTKIVRSKNPYTKKNYYWITSGGERGKRMVVKQSVNDQSGYNQTTTTAFRFYDKDSINIGKSGRDYFGDELDQTTKSRNFINTLNNIFPNSRINYRFRIVNASDPTITIKVAENNNQIYQASALGKTAYRYGREHNGSAIYTGTLPDDRSNLKFTMESGSTSARLALDYFEIEFTAQLKAAMDNLIVFSKDTTSLISYNFFNFSNSSISGFDVTDFENVKIIQGASISGGEFRFSAYENKGAISKYYGVNSGAFKTPTGIEKIENRDLRAISSGAEYVIITNKLFKSQAERLRDFRASDNLSPLSGDIFYVDEIVNQFSGGNLDPSAVRNFLSNAYKTWQTKPFYVLLFGDGDYDYLNSEKQDKNYVLTYQTRESLDEILAYPMDDYYARINGNDAKADLAIGRLNIRSVEDAETVVDKIIQYEENVEKGLWKNTITLIADDGPAATGQDDGSIHTRQTENLANNRVPKYFDQNKVYLAMYPTVATGLGRRKPLVNQAIIDAVNNGTLILNFIGHGNPDVWAHESVFEKSTTIPQLKNDKYFFLTAATCDFGKYDDPVLQSATEIMITKPNSGAIAGFTAARVVYSSSNAALNDSFYSNIFRNREGNNIPIRLGRAYFLTKQFRTEENDEKFHFFGDPALRLNEPRIPVRIDSINSTALNTDVQINALGEVSIKGTVINSAGQQNNFDGEGIISVYDSERNVEIKEMNYTVTMQGGLIYRGRVAINNGLFQTDFTVPKDISYENKNGKIISYIFNEDSDGIGVTNRIKVGGTNPNASNDGKGPEIEVFFDDISFENSNLVNRDFTLLVKLKDDTGLNTTGTGIGHKLEGILDGNETSTLDLTNYFIGDLNSGGKSGLIKFKFTGTDLGNHNIRIKAWDVFNNFSESTTYFTVVDEGTITLSDIYNYPNPFSNETDFTFQHNLTKPIDIKIKIYTVAGRLIEEIEAFNVFDKFVRVNWDGRDADGNQIANGVYFYKLIVETADGEFKNSYLGKLAVIR
ncbi:MAG: type IX secretion system sortase PorU [Melioribacteraceae bacterium]|nr:type IX secretion system sortase PorU [Melioribacteraceae bacterium]